MTAKPTSDDKAARRAEALRANLRRRKAASRKTKDSAPEKAAGETPSDGGA